MNVVTLTGWGQTYDSLKVVVPDNATKVTHIKYIDHSDFESLARSLEKKPIKCDVLIGWSLGGQISARLVEKKLIEPSLLILLAPPFQFISNKDVPYGMQSFAFMAFKNAFSLLPAATLKRFAVMMVHNDSHLRDIMHHLSIDSDNVKNWISWLEEIEKFSCKNINFSKFPKTVVIHGNNDEIVNIKQSKFFIDAIRNSKLITFKNTGHAPHLHSPQKVKDIIKEEL